MPYKMDPGSKEKNTKGTFREDDKAAKLAEKATRIESIRQKQQLAIENRDKKINASREKAITARKKIAKKRGTTYEYKPKKKSATAGKHYSPSAQKLN